MARPTFLGACVAALAVMVSLAAAQAQALSPGAAPGPNRDSLTLGLTLEPTVLDPTLNAASAVAEVTLYNIYETLTRVASDGSVQPLLAERWSVSPDGRDWRFRLRQGVKFQNGEPFSSADVKFSFERAAAPGSANKDRAVYANIQRIATPDAYSVQLHLKHADPDLLFRLGEATAVILEPRSAPTDTTQPVGTGPYRLLRWNRGASMTLARWDGWRGRPAPALRSVTLRFIAEPAAEVAALLAGDVDLFPRVAAGRSLKQFQGDARFQVLLGASRAKTILAINNRRKPLDDVRVRRAIAAAIDREAVIQGAADGFGVPIGSFYVPGAPGYVDTTALNPYDPARGRALLRESGVKLPLRLSLKLPPTPYARQGGEVIAALLAQVGIEARIENVEWAQWLSGVYARKDYDLTLIAHVEPLDLGNFALPDYYWGYASPAFDALWERIQTTSDGAQRAVLLAEAQRLVARDAVAAFLYQPRWITVADARLQGVWKDMPLFVNDLAALHWR
jgi:peptide/nickel transport system substrate-binding protein